MVGDKPCFNFANGSCRFGDRCHYSQDLSSASGTASSRHGHPARGGWQRGGAPFRGVGRELSDLSPAARDIIERNPTHQTFKRPNEQGFPDFNAVTMRSSDALLPPFKALPPRTVFGRVTGMSKDDKKINTPAVAEELLLLLNAGNNTNELWVREPAWDVADEKTFEESQSLLTKCAEVPGNFVLRLSEVIRWPDVTVKGNDKTRLSFQSAYMGVIAYLTSEAALKSALFDKVNALYGLIDINLNSVIHVLKTCIDDCLDAKTFKDPISTPYLRSKVVEITSGLQVFKPVAVMLEEYVDRYRSALTTHPELPPFIQHFEKQFTTWSEGVYAGTF